MLSAGELPPGVHPWPGYQAVGVAELFGGLEVHERLQRRDPSLNGLLQRAHFVVLLRLGDVASGAEMEEEIITRLAAIAAEAFGEEVQTHIHVQFNVSPPR